MSTEKERIDLIITGLKVYDFGNILLSRNQNMMIASFILCSCFIDHLSQHRYFKQKLKEDKFVAFIKKYLGSKYDAEELYEDLRSKLVHNYSVNGKYFLSDSDPHLKKENGRTYLNIDEFIKDLKAALEKYIDELQTDEEIRKIALAHYKKYQILSERK
jgi:hypothetical protein